MLTDTVEIIYTSMLLVPLPIHPPTSMQGSQNNDLYIPTVDNHSKNDYWTAWFAHIYEICETCETWETHLTREEFPKVLVHRNLVINISSKYREDPRLAPLICGTSREVVAKDTLTS